MQGSQYFVIVLLIPVILQILFPLLILALTSFYHFLKQIFSHSSPQIAQPSLREIPLAEKA